MFVLAAGIGRRLAPHTQDRPKCLVEVAGRTVLDWQLASAKEAGIDHLTVLGGHGADRVQNLGVPVIVNEQYATTNMVATLFCAADELRDKFIISYGDIIYEAGVLQTLVDCPHDIAVVVDQGWLGYWQRRFENPLTDAETLKIDSCGCIQEIGQKADDLSKIDFQYIGLMKFKGRGVDVLHTAYRQAVEEDSQRGEVFRSGRNLAGLYMTDLLQGIVDQGHDVHAVPIQRQWLEIDSCEDLALAKTLITVEGDRLRIGQ